MKPASPSKPRRKTAVSRLATVAPEALQSDFAEIQIAIARRAYELFEAHRCDHGHDREDWFQAEAELLNPVPFATTEDKDSITVRADVFGFEADELKTAIEPRRVLLLGKKPSDAAARAAAKNLESKRILCVIDLPSEIDPSEATVQFKSGVITFNLPKVMKSAIAKETEAA